MGSKTPNGRGCCFWQEYAWLDVRNGKMYVNEEGAEVVRKIFYKFVEERKSTHTIAMGVTRGRYLPDAEQKVEKYSDFAVFCRMKMFVGIWCRRRHLHRIIFLMRKNIIGVRRSL